MGNNSPEHEAQLLSVVTSTDTNPEANPEVSHDAGLDANLDANPGANPDAKPSQSTQDPPLADIPGDEQDQYVPESIGITLSTQQDRTAKGSKFWDRTHAPPSPGHPDRHLILSQRVDPIPSREEFLRRVQQWKKTTVGDGTEDPNPMGDHLRASTPPLERVKKVKEQLEQIGFDITDENYRTIFEHHTRNSGLVASLQEYLADKRDVPVEHVNKLLLQRDELMFELAKQVEYQKKQGNGGTDSDDDMQLIKQQNAELQARNKTLERENQEWQQKFEQAEEEMYLKEKECGLEKIELKGQIFQLTCDLRELKASRATEGDGEMREMAIQTDFDTKPDQLVSAEARLAKAQKQIDAYKAFCEYHYSELVQEQSSWGLIINIMLKAKEWIQKDPLQSFKILRQIYLSLQELERRFLLNWPGIGPSLPGHTVRQDILTKAALDKAKASLKKRLAEVLVLNSELDAHQNIKHERMRQVTKDEDDDEIPSHLFDVSSNTELTDDLKSFLQDDMELDSQSDKGENDKDGPLSAKSSPMIFNPNSPVDEALKTAVKTSQPSVSATWLKDVSAELAEAQDEPITQHSAMNVPLADMTARHNEEMTVLKKEMAALKKEKEEAEAKAKEVKTTSHIVAAKLEQLRERWAKANDKVESLEKLVQELKDEAKKRDEQKEEATATSAQHYDGDAQFRTIEGLLQRFSPKDPEKEDDNPEKPQPEANKMDQLNSFNIQFMFSLRTLTLEALQQGWTQGAHRMLDIFNKWFYSARDQLNSLNKDVLQEIEGSRYILEACWHLYNNQDTKMARDAQAKGYDKLKGISQPWKIDAYLQLAKKLEEDVDALEKGSEGSGEGASPRTRPTSREAGRAQAARLAGVPEFQIQSWKLQMQQRETDAVAEGAV